VANPITRLRLILQQIFQGINNIFFDKTVDKKINDPNARGADLHREIKEPVNYKRISGIKQMCSEKPYHKEHAFGLTYEFEEQKVAPTFSGPQYQIYLERAKELCDEDPECKYFNLWTDGGIWKYKECENLVSSKYMRTMVFEKIPDPPPPGTSCEDKGHEPYDWYDLQRGKVKNTEGAGEATAEWDENGRCVRTSCKNDKDWETSGNDTLMELDVLRKCVPGKMEKSSDEQQIDNVVFKKYKETLVKAYQKKLDLKKSYKQRCLDEWNSWNSKNLTGLFDHESVTWRASGLRRNRDYVVSNSGMCGEHASHYVDNFYDPETDQGDGFGDTGYGAAEWW